MHLLHVVQEDAERVELYQRAIQVAVDEGDLLLVIDSEAGTRVVTALLGLETKPRPEARVLDIDSLIGEQFDWQRFCTELEVAITATERQRGDSRITVVVALDEPFERCESVSEVMSIEYELDRIRNQKRRILLTGVKRSSIPSSLPLEFFSLHTDWSFGDDRSDSLATSSRLDEAVRLMTLAAPPFRHRFLATTRSKERRLQATVPRFLDSLRHGILMVDPGYTIRFVSGRAAGYLGRSERDLIDRPLKTCLDGVDYISIKHECEKLARGFDADTPLTVSWRLAPGVYEPRVATIDPIFSDNQLVGFLMTVSRVQSIRGPRAVYQQLTEEERAAANQAVSPVDDEPDLGDDEAISESIQGTQVTRREHEIILQILKGMSNKEIADLLKIAEVTVKKHLTSVYRKLRITNRRELLASFQVPKTGGDPHE